MNERHRFLATCISAFCIAAIGGGVYLVIDAREREDNAKAADRAAEYHKRLDEAKESAIRQFDGNKANRVLVVQFQNILHDYSNANSRFPFGYPTYVYEDDGTFSGTLSVDINYSDTGWQRCTYSFAFYPSGSLAKFEQIKSEPLQSAPTATK
jgi:hypothetical protein